MIKLPGDTVNFSTDTKNNSISIIHNVNEISRNISAGSSRRRFSSLWNHFTPISGDSHIAICKICKVKLSFKSTNTNLRRHLQWHHPHVKLIPRAPVTVTKKDNRTGEYTAAIEKLLSIFTQDLLPLSFIEGEGFRSYSAALNPEFKIPSIRDLTEQVLPAVYNECYEKCSREVKMAKTICLTIDSWNSVTNDTYISLTGHFIDNSFAFRSIMLKSYLLPKQATFENVADQILNVMLDWQIYGKVVFSVSGNRGIIKTALSKQLDLGHFDCYGSSINSVINASLADGHNMTDLLSSVNLVVEYFKQNGLLNTNFLPDCKNDTSLELSNLLQMREDSANWNSIYYSLSQLTELRKFVQNPANIINCEIPTLTPEQWTICNELCSVLKLFDQITQCLSSTKYPPASIIIPLTSGLLDLCDTLMEKDFSDVVKKMIETVKTGLQDKMKSVENNSMLAVCTFLDPRFKAVAFRDSDNAKNAKRLVISAMRKLSCTKEMYDSLDRVLCEADENELLWNSFPPECKEGKKPKTAKHLVISALLKLSGTRETVDALTRDSSTSESSESDCDSEMEVIRYLDTKIIPEDDSPYQWWRVNGHNYPSLRKLFVEKFCVPAMSAPCEWIFTKRGHMLAERRSRLPADNVEKLIFLNANYTSSL